MFNGGRLLAFVVLAFAACNKEPGPAHGGADMTLGVGGGGEVDMGAEPVGLDMTGIDEDMLSVYPLVIAPLDQVLAMDQGAMPPSVQYTATVNGAPISPSWSIDRGELGTIDVSSGRFIAAGTMGGKAIITAVYKGQTASTSVTVNVNWKQITGDPDYPPPAPGPGGYGGVGGDGPAPAPTPTQQGTLDGTPIADASVKILYPYDGTVWPRGLLAPLFQWDPGAHKLDGLKIELKEGNFAYTGYFKAQSADPAFVFKNAPLPQAVWKELGLSNNGTEVVKVALTFSEGDKAYGPYLLGWKIARGSLRGTVYYNSYGTAFVLNSGERSCGPGDKCYCAPGATNCTTSTVRTGPAFGAATLAIHPGDTSPALVAGKDIANPTNSVLRPGCRGCHYASADGSRLMVNDPDGNYNTSYAYDLTQPPPSRNVEYGNNWTVPNNPNNVPQPNNTNCTTCSWSNIYPALFPNGRLYLSSSGSDRGDANSFLYDLSSSQQVSNPKAGVSGLNGLKAALPVFSPDGKHVAFNDASYDKRSLGVIDFDVATLAFKDRVRVHTPANGTVSWSSFLPTSDGIVFQVEHGSPNPAYPTPDIGFTRWNTGELWWYDMKTKMAAPLNRLNGYVGGKLYLPTNDATYHTATLEPQLSYEPAVCPIVSGGYAWVVITSRRLYGNVATMDGYLSDPRQYDWQHQITTKKLWVAAIDLNSVGGADPSHPAFYLPAQELYAGNARGFWTAVPCHKDGDGCETGDECCGGYCRSAPSGGGLQCLSTPPSCATEYEKCTTDADCCGHESGNISCINKICSGGVISIVNNPPKASFAR